MDQFIDQNHCLHGMLSELIWVHHQGCYFQGGRAACNGVLPWLSIKSGMVSQISIYGRVCSAYAAYAHVSWFKQFHPHAFWVQMFLGQNHCLDQSECVLLQSRPRKTLAKSCYWSWSDMVESPFLWKVNSLCAILWQLATLGKWDPEEWSVRFIVWWIHGFCRGFC